jgi:hypothetical protein
VAEESTDPDVSDGVTATVADGDADAGVEAGAEDVTGAEVTVPGPVAAAGLLPPPKCPAA